MKHLVFVMRIVADGLEGSTDLVKTKMFYVKQLRQEANKCIEEYTELNKK